MRPSNIARPNSPDPATGRRQRRGYVVRFLIDSLIVYRIPGPLTDLSTVEPSAQARIGTDPVAICEPVHSLITRPQTARENGFPEERIAENRLRPVAAVSALYRSGDLQVPADLIC